MRRALRVVKGNTIEEQIASIDQLLSALFSRGDAKNIMTRVTKEEVKVIHPTPKQLEG